MKAWEYIVARNVGRAYAKWLRENEKYERNLKFQDHTFKKNSCVRQLDIKCKNIYGVCVFLILVSIALVIADTDRFNRYSIYNADFFVQIAIILSVFSCVLMLLTLAFEFSPRFRDKFSKIRIYREDLDFLTSFFYEDAISFLNGIISLDKTHFYLDEKSMSKSCNFVLADGYSAIQMKTDGYEYENEYCNPKAKRIFEKMYSYIDQKLNRIIMTPEIEKNSKQLIYFIVRNSLIKYRFEEFASKNGYPSLEEYCIENQGVVPSDFSDYVYYHIFRNDITLPLGETYDKILIEYLTLSDKLFSKRSEKPSVRHFEDCAEERQNIKEKFSNIPDIVFVGENEKEEFPKKFDKIAVVLGIGIIIFSAVMTHIY